MPGDRRSTKNNASRLHETAEPYRPTSVQATTLPLRMVGPPASSERRSGHSSYYDEVRKFKQDLLRRVLGNRTHSANALGLQRTYLQRLIRELEVQVPRKETHAQ